MDLNALKEMHKGIIYVYLAFFTFKLVMMFINREKFRVIRNKTKLVEMILGTAILATGLITWNAYNWNVENWLLVKIGMFLLAIPLGIIGMKREKLPLAVISLILLLSAFVLALNHNSLMP